MDVADSRSRSPFEEPQLATVEVLVVACVGIPVSFQW